MYTRDGVFLKKDKDGEVYLHAKTGSSYLLMATNLSANIIFKNTASDEIETDLESVKKLIIAQFAAINAVPTSAAVKSVANDSKSEASKAVNNSVESSSQTAAASAHVVPLISGNAKVLGNLYLTRSASQEELSQLKNHVDGTITTDMSPEDAIAQFKKLAIYK